MPENDQSNESPSFEVEITDLDVSQCARGGVRARMDQLLLRWQRAEYRRTRLWLSGVLLTGFTLTLIVTLLNPVAGISALLAEHWPFHSASTSLTVQGALPGQVLLQNSNQIRCPVQTAWAPDSSLVAILGYTQPCSQSEYVPGQIDLYDAATAHQIAHWQPDKAILEAVQQLPEISIDFRAWESRKAGNGSPQATIFVPVIQYLQMLWSPDSTRIAISFEALNSLINYQGLFLADTDGSHARVLLQPEASRGDRSNIVPLQWDLQTNSAVLLDALPPALTYTWDAHDALVPLTPLNAQTDLSAYTLSQPGNPSGGRTFSIWQPGRPRILSPRHTYGTYLWSSNFAAWSPDGRYLVAGISFTGLMVPPGQNFPAPEILTALDVQSLPHIPAHDPALLPAAANAQAVAWNPAGTVLAVYDRAGMVDLYDCQSGRLLHSLTPAQAGPLSGSAVLLSWAPNGHSLLLSSAQWGLITLWDEASLHAG